MNSLEKQPGKFGLITLFVITGNILVWIANIFVDGSSIRKLFITGEGCIKAFGEATFPSVIIQHEWWRLLTCGYIHTGILHLFFNALALLIIGSKMEKYIGHLKIFIFYHSGIAITAFFWCLLFQDGYLIGASPGIFTLLGMYIMLSRANNFNADFSLAGSPKNYLIAYVIISCLPGIGTITVHFIGFITGSLFAIIYRQFSGKSRQVI